MEQYSNLNVHGKIKQMNGEDGTGVQGTASNDVLIVKGIAPRTDKPSTSTGISATCFKGQTAVVSGATYLCTNVTNNVDSQHPLSDSTVWTYTWTMQGNPSNVTGPGSSVDGHVALFNGTTGKIIKDSGFAIPAPASDYEGKALIVANTAGSGQTPVYQFAFGEAGKVDCVQINGTVIAGEGTDPLNKTANIPPATSEAFGVIKVGSTLETGTGASAGVLNQKSGVITATTKGSATKVPTVEVDTYGRVIALTDVTVTPAWGDITSKPSSYTPSAHAAPTDLYGGASPANYGHVKFDETIDSNRQDYTEYSGYTGFNSVNDYVGYYVNSNNTKVLVTDSNKSSLGITAGTTKAYVPTSTVLAISEKGIVDFVNSSISTATANFLGTFTALEYRLYADYMGFDSVDDYVNYYVVYNNVYTQVTSSNKSSLGIVVGTTKAYTKPEDSLKFTQSQVDQMVDPYSVASEAISTRLGNPTDYHVPSNPSPNDYVFVEMDFTDPATSPDEYRRYKWSGSAWLYEYTLNNSSFTVTQWNAINSGITASDVTKLNGIADGAEVNVQSNWNETNTSSDAYIQNKPTFSTGLSVNGANVVTIAPTNVSSGSYGPTQTTSTTLAYRGTFKVPKYTVGADGRLTNSGDIQFTLPASDNTDYKMRQVKTDISANYPLLMSDMTVEGAESSVSSQWDTSSMLNTHIYAQPYTGEITAVATNAANRGHVISATIPPNAGAYDSIIAKYSGTYQGEPGYVKFRVDASAQFDQISNATLYRESFIAECMWDADSDGSTLQSCKCNLLVSDKESSFINSVGVTIPHTFSDGPQIYVTGVTDPTGYGVSVVVTILEESGSKLDWRTQWGDDTGTASSGDTPSEIYLSNYATQFPDAYVSHADSASQVPYSGVTSNPFSVEDVPNITES